MTRRPSDASAAPRGALRALVRGLRDRLAQAFPARTRRKRWAEAEQEMERRAAGERDPAWRAPLPPPARSHAVQLVALYVTGAAQAAGTGEAPADWGPVASARPQFLRHIQPHVPADLGLYDPASADTLRRQVELARAYGIAAFCFQLEAAEAANGLPAPLAHLLAMPDLDIRFSVLISGDASGLQAVSAARLLDALGDPRALKIDGRLLLAFMQPPPETVVGVLRRAARLRLGHDLFLAEAFAGQARLSPGFDAVVQVPPIHLPAVGTPRRIKPIDPRVTLWVDEHLALADAAVAQARAVDLPLVPGACAGFDDTPLRPGRGRILVAADPADAFARWLAEAASLAEERPVGGERLVFVNAWNDWGQGAHLEPDQRLGHALLRAAANALAPYAVVAEPAAVEPAPVADAGGHPQTEGAACVTVIHTFYPDLLERLLAGLDLTAPLYVTVPPDGEAAVREILDRLAPGAQVRVYENRGRDVRPFLLLLPELQAQGFRVVLKLHTKRSPHHEGRGADWLAQLSGPLSRLQREGGLLPAFADHPGLGMLGAEGHVLDGATYAGVAGNAAWIRRVCRRLELPDLPADYGYVAGTMFAARLALFAPLAARGDVLEWFEPDMGLTDGTLAHAFERLFGGLAALAGQTIGTVGEREGSGLDLVPQAQPLKRAYAFAPRDGD